MSYEPVEGVDYIVDLYAVTGVEHDADNDAIKKALNQRSKEYHPDRLEGVAPEFRDKGERMARLLNRARGILLNPESRAEYDDILENWEGPLSRDGTPAITIDALARAEVTGKTSDEIEGLQVGRRQKYEVITGYNPQTVEFLESLIEQSKASGTEINPTLREQYEIALLQQDRVLAIESSDRAQLLGMEDPQKKRYVAELGYAGNVAEEIMAARTELLEEARLRAIGGVSGRLALLAGETVAAPDATLEPYEPALPDYYEEQSQLMLDLAKRREEITTKRLENFEPEYPMAELQTKFSPHVAVELMGTWMHLRFDLTSGSVEFDHLPLEILQLAEAENFGRLIDRGFNVMRLSLLDHIHYQDLLTAAAQHYQDKYDEHES